MNLMLVCLIAPWLVAHGVMAQESLPRGLTEAAPGISIVECLYLRAHQVSIDEDGKQERGQISHKCKTFAWEEYDGYGEMVYNLDDPVLVAQLNFDELESGISVLRINGAAIHRKAEDPSDPDKLLIYPKVTVEFIHEEHRRLELRRKGPSSMLVVRVITPTAATEYTTDILRERFFSQNAVSLASQYNKCSNGVKTFTMGQYTDGISNVIIGIGVANLNIDSPTTGQEMTVEIENELLLKFQMAYGSVDQFDHIVYCMPIGMRNNWIGYTYGQTYRSYYNNRWCGYYSLPFHEIGHNLGLQHSNEGGVEYEDRSCMMGSSRPQIHSPSKCFNGVKFAQFDWFPEHTELVDFSGDNTSWNGNLAAFVDVSKLTPNTVPIILIVGDAFLVYNRAKDYNFQTEEKPNEVTIARGTTLTCNACTSTMLGGIKPQDAAPKTFDVRFSTDDLTRVTFESCIAGVAEGEIDLMEISIYLEGSPSGCPGVVAPPTPLPTILLTPNPTLNPTSQPTLQPTPQPTLQVTPQPTHAPIPYCFSQDSTVLVKDKGEIQMKSLTIGDVILVGADGKFDEVYSFGHWCPECLHNFLVINNRLEISASHLIAVQGRGFVPASNISVGDKLVSGAVPVNVHSIERRTNRGAFAPFTRSGTLMVNGVLVSSFVSMQQFSADLMLGDFSTGLSWHWLAHKFEFVHRFCYSLDLIGTESYTKDGISSWVSKPHAFASWLMNQHIVAQVLIWIPIILLAILFSAIESTFLFATTFLGLIVLFWLKRRRVKTVLREV